MNNSVSVLLCFSILLSGCLKGTLTKLTKNLISTGLPNLGQTNSHSVPGPIKLEASTIEQDKAAKPTLLPLPSPSPSLLDYSNQKTYQGSLIITDINGKLISGPSDKMYDWGISSLLDDDGKYRIWWTRGGGETHDTIWTAESLDKIHWEKAQKIIEPDHLEACALLKEQKKFVDQCYHAGDPSVVKVNGIYYLFYESPNYNEQGQIYLATSTDAKNWKKYIKPGAIEATPVLSLPTVFPTSDAYGIGMPSVFYLNGYFVMSYLYSPGWPDLTKIARTKDPTNWGDSTQHEVLFKETSQIALTYYEKLSKYVLISSTGLDFYLFTSKDLTNWEGGQKIYSSQTFPLESLWQVYWSKNLILPSENKAHLFPGFMNLNTHGLIEGDSIQFTFTQGDKAELGKPFTSTAETWDLYEASYPLETQQLSQ